MNRDNFARTSSRATSSTNVSTLLSRRRAAAQTSGVAHNLVRPDVGRASGSSSISISALFSHRRSEEHTSELQSLMRISYAVFCLKKKKPKHTSKYQTPYITPLLPIYH